ncbi:MAG: NHL repeat-containing protein [Solirubrobacteraceae bacterium]
MEIAADAKGEVYLPNAPHNEIQVFNEEGSEVATITGAAGHALKRPEGVAIGPHGNVWVADTGDGRIEEFEPNGTFLKEIASPGVRAVALDGAGQVFASIGGSKAHVAEYNASSGLPVAGAEEIGQGLLSESTNHTFNGLAFDSKREVLYVANGGGNDVLRFGDWAATTEPPGNLAPGSATLNGSIEVEPGTSIAACRFEYGPTTKYGHTVPCEKPGGGGAPFTASTPVSAHVSGLNGDTHYRIALANAAGEYTKVGADRVFGPPAVGGGAAEAAVTTATLRAHVTVLEAGSSRCTEAQYVSAAEYAASGFAHAHSVPCVTPIPSTPGAYSVETGRITGLAPSTVYDYRFLTENHVGTEVGPDETVATFGIASGTFAFGAVGETGEPFMQAGAHPYGLTDSFRLNTSTNQLGDVQAVDSNPKDILTELPAGLIGNPDATPKCKPYDVAHAECSGATQIGTISLYTSNPEGVADHGGQPVLSQRHVPIYNLVPPKGLAAQFGARFNGFVTIHIDSRVRTGGDYGVTAEVIDSSTGEGLVGAEVTLWGVPGEEGHDAERYCPVVDKINEVAPCTERGPPIPLLSNPTSCSGEREARMSVEPWQEDEPRVVVGASEKMPAITGCGHVHFAPSMTVTPTSTSSDSPSGLDVELKVPQNEAPQGLATADLKDAKVVLPPGVTVNPSAANGLAGCPLLSGKGSHAGEAGIDLENGEAANCPNASKIGSVHIKTPLLEEELEGGVYVAQQNANPFKTLLALYISAEARQRGVVVKLAGKVSVAEEPGKALGQVVTTFDENPQLPFEVLKLDFFGGERAALATPRTCGSYRATALLEPWSHHGAPGEAGTPNAEPLIEPFAIASGPAGAQCAPPAFSPFFEAGVVNNQAGAFGSFVMNLTRRDGEQTLSTVAMTMPPGLAGMISRVPLCPEAQALADACGAASQIGHVTVQAGVGSEPVSLPQAGRAEDPVYLLGPTEGAPFGLAIVVHPEAGPFNLEEGGRPVIVLAKIAVNDRTGQVSVQSKAMPSILQGIPVDVKAIHVEVNRPGFMFNPTDCAEQHVDGTIGSLEGASAVVSSRFQAANCASLPFSPVLSAQTHAYHTRKAGSFLKVTIGSKAGEANLSKVRVTLPKKLPAELSTLKQACSEAQFDANPAGCPKASFVGSVVVHTPVLSVPLTGPAIYVSHGAAKFPDLAFVLQGEGVSIIQEGATEIKKGLTSSSFEAIPDLPVERIEVSLPEGEKPALGGNGGNLCYRTIVRRRRVKVRRHGRLLRRGGRVVTRTIKLRRDVRAALIMPTSIVGQNGAVVQRETKVDVSGCGAKAKPKAGRRAGRHSKKHGRKGKGRKGRAGKPKKGGGAKR